MEFKLTSSV